MMEKQKILKTCGIILCSFVITSVGFWLLYHDTKMERASEPAFAEIETTEMPSATSLPITTENHETIHEKLELNTATKEELSLLPGIGEGLAERIVQYRKEKPFKVVRDLKKITGIGDKKFEGVRHLVYVAEKE